MGTESKEITAKDLFDSSDSEEGALPSGAEEVIPQRRPARKRPSQEDEEAHGAAFRPAGLLSDGYDEQLYGDAQDRAKLLAMTEIDREAILYERAQARLARAERKELERKVRDMERLEQLQLKAPLDKKKQGLEALKAARERKKRRANGEDDSGEEEEDDDEEEGQLGSEESAYSEEEVVEKPKPTKGKISASAKKEDPIDFELANKIRLSRNMLVQWLYHPQFDELARGTLLRLAIGSDSKGEQVYRLVEVRKIVPYYRTYRIGQAALNKAVILRYGKSERTFRLDVVSNSEFTQREYERWRATLQNEGLPAISKRAGSAKAEAWSSFLEAPVSDEAVKAMVAAKREAGSAHRNLVAERTQLLALREEAEAAGNSEELEQIDTELASISKDLEESQAKRQGSSRLEALAEINKRNRQLNVSIAREAEKISANSRGASSGGAVRMDPFSRRKCQPTSFHDFSDLDAPSSAAETAPTQEKPAEVATQPASPKKKKLDLFAVHDVDIDIDI